MRLSVKIWLLAILYQTIIFSLMQDGFSEFIVILIPIELLGGLPGLLIFDVILKYLKSSQEHIVIKWIWVITGTSVAAFLTTTITALFFGDVVKAFFAGEHFILLYAPIAALLGLFTFSIPIQKLLNEHARNLYYDDSF